MAKINFDKLPKAKQRVVIARDLIARLDAKEFVAKSGTYFDVRLTPKELADKSTEVRDLLKHKVCKGCQIGGLFLCAVDRHNKLSIGNFGNPTYNESGMREYLRTFFSDRQLNEVEKAFEQWEEFDDWKVRQPADRMRAIANNIIRNKGRFVGGQLLNS